MNEKAGFGFMPPEESKSADLWLPILLALIFAGPRPSSGIKMDVSVENIHVSEAKISPEK